METIIEEDQDLLLMQEKPPGEVSPWVLRIEIDPKLLRRKPLRLSELTVRIRDEFPENRLRLIESLEVYDPIVLRMRLLESHGDSFQRTKKMEQFILEEMPIKGFCNKVSYKRSQIYEYGPEGVTKTESTDGEYVLETSGNSLGKVLLIPTVDKTRTFTNDINVMIEIFGIEAGRLSILREIREVFNHFGIYVNYRHIGLLADIITRNGSLMAISRNGINKVYGSPLRKCSFEQTVEVLIEAAVYAELDNVRGVSENIILGQLCHIGTGSFDLIMDNDLFLKDEDNFEKFPYVTDTAPLIPQQGDANHIFDQPLISPSFANSATTPHMMNTPRYETIMTSNIFTPGTPGGRTPTNPMRAGAFATPKYPGTPGMNPNLYSPFSNQKSNPNSMSKNPMSSNQNAINQRSSTNPLGKNQNNINTPFSPILDQGSSTHRLSSPYMAPSSSGLRPAHSSGRGDIRFTPRTPNYNPGISSPFARQASPSPYNVSAQGSGYSTNSPYYSPATSNQLSAHSSGNMTR